MNRACLTSSLSSVSVCVFVCTTRSGTSVFSEPIVVGAAEVRGRLPNHTVITRLPVSTVIHLEVCRRVDGERCRDELSIGSIFTAASSTCGLR